MISYLSKSEINNLVNSFSNSKINDNLSNASLSVNEDHSAKLPPEILLHIFRFVSRYDLQHSVSLVSKRWHQLVRDPTLLKVLKLGKKTPLSIVNQYIEERPLLTVLKARGLECINETIEKIVVWCPFLLCLDIGFCDIFEETIFSICQYARNLKHLNLEGIQLSHMMVDSLCTYLPQLEILNLSHCTNLTDPTIYSISRKLKLIQALNIDGIQNITDYGIVYICQLHAINLHSIWIDGCELTEIGLQALTTCINLSFLSISYADSLTDIAVYPLRCIGNLRSLSIHKATQFTKPAMLDLFDKDDSRLSNLTSLDLNECSVIDDEVLARILVLCGDRLRVLSLQWCWNITDDGLAQLVSVAVLIERLSLIGNHIIRGTAFQSLPEKWPRLRLLNLTNCNQIDDDLLNIVARCMPDTYIFDYFGERFGDDVDSVTQYDIARALEKMPICDHV